MVVESSTRDYVVSMGLMFRCDLSGECFSEASDTITADLLETLKAFAERHPGFELLLAPKIHSLDCQDVNAVQCSQCGRWASDHTAPGYIDALPGGSNTHGRFICSECDVRDYWYH